MNLPSQTQDELSSPVGREEDTRRQFRDAMSGVAYSVCAVTTDGAHGRDGMTVTAMVPVSDAGLHPVLLVCLRTGSRVLPKVLGNGVFCVNVLSEDDLHIAERLAGRDSGDIGDWFGEADWSRSGNGAPAFRGAVSCMECEVLTTNRVEGHEVVFGRVTAITSGHGARPLLHARRRYGRMER